MAGAKLEPCADLRNVCNIQDLRPVHQHVRPELWRGGQEQYPGALPREHPGAVRHTHPVSKWEIADGAIEYATRRHMHRAHVIM